MRVGKDRRINPLWALRSAWGKPGQASRPTAWRPVPAFAGEGATMARAQRGCALCVAKVRRDSPASRAASITLTTA